MAEAIVSVLSELGILLIEEGRSFGGVHDQVESLRQELMQMQSFLRDVEDRETTSANVRTWLADVQQVAHDAKNLIDTFILNKEQQKRRRFFKRYFLLLHDFLALRKFGKKIERIQTNIRSIFNRRSTYNIQNIGGDRGEPSSSTETLRQQRQISPHSGEMLSTVGLSNDVKLLEERLIRGKLRRDVISIVGMGGLGKTTLAKSLYNSGVVRHHFDCFAWIYVSQQFQPRLLLQEIQKQIIKSRGGERVLESEANVAEDSLFQILKNMKYMIVLDDVWTTDVWTSIEGNFPNSKGSRIVLTTRRRDVALHAEPTSIPHKLKLLDKEDSWKLFTNMLYKVEKDTPPDLKEIGRRIVGKCGGLPLAIKLIGGLLSTKKETLEAWSNVFHSLSWHLNQNPVQYSSILAMSYNDLPSYLKPCFLYFAIFPEGFQIPDKRLIRLWIAEGIIQKRGEEELEDIGNDYIEELADRYIIQTRSKDRTLNFHLSTEKEEKQKKITEAVTEENLGRRNLECSMHDLVREVSLSIARNVDRLDIYVNRDNDASSFNSNKKRVRRLAVHFDGEDDSTSWEGSFPNLHSLSVFDLSEGVTERGEEIGNFLHRSIVNEGFEWLTVLDLEGTYKPRLPKELGKLIHLRYLGLRRTWLDKLPSSVANLFNLQTLDLKCTEIQVIPSAIWKMQQLRHLYLNGEIRSKVLIQTSKKHKSFTSLSRHLRTLCGIFLGPEDCVTDKLEKLTKIRKLAIEGDLNSQGGALGYWIGRLERLEHLKLRSTAGDKKPIGTSSFSTTTTEEQSYALPWLGTLRAHSSLRKLHLEGNLADSMLLWRSLNMLSILTLVKTQMLFNPMQILKELPNLRILRLWYNSYIGSFMDTSSGSFPKLQVLEVCWLDELEHWVIDKGSMPNLRELEINKCNKLRKLPYGLEYLTNLEELRLPTMSDRLRSRVLPYTGEDWYKIKHIPFIRPPLFSDAPFTAAAVAVAAASASASAGAASTSSSSYRPLFDRMFKR